jgi:aspartate racemase
VNGSSPVLGILGGLGPMSSVYFYELITSHTDAKCDQEHIDIILSSRATTPDRTAYITGASDQNPLPVMIEETHRLAGAGADIIAVPCNTAHYFYASLRDASSVPLLNIIELTVKYAKSTGAISIGLMATEGTAKAGAYRAVCNTEGIGCFHCNPADQEKLNHIIYGSVKRGLPPDMNEFYSVSEHLHSLGSSCLILGCTELSLIKKTHDLPDIFIDSLEVLAACTIAACGKKMRGFPRALEEFALAHTIHLIQKG